MSVATKLARFVLVLAAAFGAGFAVGSAAQGEGAPAPAHEPGNHQDHSP